MKNVILSFNELQLNMFLSFAEGLRRGLEIPKGYFFTPQHDKHKDEFSFEVWKSATKPEHGDAKCILKHTFSTGEYQMNDHRLGVLIAFMSNQSLYFMEKLRDTPILSVIDTVRSAEPPQEYIMDELTGQKHYTDQR